ncbi:MAG TPA: hypothetical protein PLP30_03995 [Clostridia bacterium]|nr:hypothetical protein [Clostridia bacterium]HPQ46507.1 hypothetical protein [Clostridia bacterium]HRX43184.1 hypothetical protein [Clostridia bacterium]
MYNWNGINILVHGDNQTFIERVSKYINAPAVSDSSANADIDVLITSRKACIPTVDDEARLVKKLEYQEDFINNLSIYNKGELLWYIYEDMAEIYVDMAENKMIVMTEGLPLDFEYYNILIFMFHPFGYLFENFRFYRIHSSCAVLGEKAFLATGNTGSGKSTSAFALHSCGGSIISDDLTYVCKKNGKYLAYSLSSLVKLRDDALSRFFPEMSYLPVFCRFLDETYFNTKDMNKTTPGVNVIEGIGILEKTMKKESSYHMAKPIEVVPEMFPSTIHTTVKHKSAEKFTFITEMLNNIKCYKIGFGTDIQSYYNTVKRLLEEG